jgi:hypothetical protein
MIFYNIKQGKSQAPGSLKFSASLRPFGCAPKGRPKFEKGPVTRRCAAVCEGVRRVMTAEKHGNGAFFVIFRIGPRSFAGKVSNF